MKIAVITISDTRTPENDISGDGLAELAAGVGEVAARMIVRDEMSEIIDALKMLSRDAGIDLILTAGGTGIAPRDVTAEATLAVIEREIPGIAEAMRRETYSKTPMSMLSRGICGVANGTLIINLPGSPKGVEECFAVVAPVLRHAIDQIAGNTKH